MRFDWLRRYPEQPVTHASIAPSLPALVVPVCPGVGILTHCLEIYLWKTSLEYIMLLNHSLQSLSCHLDRLVVAFHLVSAAQAHRGGPGLRKTQI